jgi:hypothetical protein
VYHNPITCESCTISGRSVPYHGTWGFIRSASPMTTGAESGSSGVVTVTRIFSSRSTCPGTTIWRASALTDARGARAAQARQLIHKPRERRKLPFCRPPCMGFAALRLQAVQRHPPFPCGRRWPGAQAAVQATACPGPEISALTAGSPPCPSTTHETPALCGP